MVLQPTPSVPSSLYDLAMGKPYYCHTKLGVAMVKLGWSVQDLAFEAKVNPRYIGYYLKGEKAMNPDHLRVIAQAMNVDPRSIFQTQAEMGEISPHSDHQRARQSGLKVELVDEPV